MKNIDRTEEFCVKLKALLEEALAIGVDAEWLLEVAQNILETDADDNDDTAAVDDFDRSYGPQAAHFRNKKGSAQ